jgi:hypothetical protein
MLCTIHPIAASTTVPRNPAISIPKAAQQRQEQKQALQRGETKQMDQKGSNWEGRQQMGNMKLRTKTS